MIPISKILHKARIRLINLHKETGSGHIGGNLSCLDALIVLFHKQLKKQDHFILSKGHAAGALYVTLWSKGQLSEKKLQSFCKDNTKLPGHPSGNGIPRLKFSTGSLGHGPSLAAGLALAAKKKGNHRNVFCLTSDGEWQEGSCWEALIFAVHHKLTNLIILVDQNGWQGFGTTKEVVSFSDLSSRLSAFGAKVIKCPGHSLKRINKSLQLKNINAPTVIILQTKKGKGTLFENKLESHYLPFTDENYKYAFNKR